MSDMFEQVQDPWTRMDQRPAGVPGDHAITTAAPTGYYPDARTSCDVPYAEKPVYEYETAPVEIYDGATKLDQHPMMHVTATWTPAPDGNGRRTGTRDPLESGPARPDTLLLSLFSYRGAGTGNTKYMDVPDGRVFSQYGTQDGASWLYYQDIAQALAPYVPGAPAPVDTSQTATAQNTMYKVPPGPAHGWTSIPVVNVKQLEVDKATRLLKQQKSPHQDRKSNSTYAGQSYSQQTSNVTQQGAGAIDDPWRERG